MPRTILPVTVALYIDHGTQLMQLKPLSILAAAEEDVVRFHRNTNTEAWIVRPSLSPHARAQVDACALCRGALGPSGR